MVTIAEAFAAWSMINAKYPLELKTPIRLSPETVNFGRFNAINRYKNNKVERVNEHGEKFQIIDEYEQVIDWKNDNGFVEHDFFDYPKYKDYEPALADLYRWLIFITSRMWDYEFKRAYKLYVSLKANNILAF